MIRVHMREGARGNRLNSPIVSLSTIRVGFNAAPISMPSIGYVSVVRLFLGKRISVAAFLRTRKVLISLWKMRINCRPRRRLSCRMPKRSCSRSTNVTTKNSPFRLFAAMFSVNHLANAFETGRLKCWGGRIAVPSQHLDKEAPWRLFMLFLSYNHPFMTWKRSKKLIPGALYASVLKDAQCAFNDMAVRRAACIKAHFRLFVRRYKCIYRKKLISSAVHFSLCGKNASFTIALFSLSLTGCRRKKKLINFPPEPELSSHMRHDKITLCNALLTCRTTD